MFTGTISSVDYAFGGIILPAKWSFPKSSLVVQLVEPQQIYGKTHLIHSISTSLKAFSIGKQLTTSKSLELLLRITGIKQISKAISTGKPKRRAVLIVYGPKANKEYKRLVKELNAKNRALIKQRSGELDAMERAALLWL